MHKQKKKNDSFETSTIHPICAFHKKGQLQIMVNSTSTRITIEGKNILLAIFMHIGMTLLNVLFRAQNMDGKIGGDPQGKSNQSSRG